MLAYIRSSQVCSNRGCGSVTVCIDCASSKFSFIFAGLEDLSNLSNSFFFRFFSFFLLLRDSVRNEDTVAKDVSRNVVIILCDLHQANLVQPG
jgi:hypothetical protein